MHVNVCGSVFAIVVTVLHSNVIRAFTAFVNKSPIYLNLLPVSYTEVNWKQTHRIEIVLMLGGQALSAKRSTRSMYCCFLTLGIDHSIYGVGSVSAVQVMSSCILYSSCAFGQKSIASYQGANLNGNGAFTKFLCTRRIKFPPHAEGCSLQEKSKDISQIAMI